MIVNTGERSRGIYCLGHREAVIEHFEDSPKRYVIDEDFQSDNAMGYLCEFTDFGKRETSCQESADVEILIVELK